HDEKPIAERTEEEATVRFARAGSHAEPAADERSVSKPLRATVSGIWLDVLPVQRAADPAGRREADALPGDRRPHGSGRPGHDRAAGPSGKARTHHKKTLLGGSASYLRRTHGLGHETAEP